MEERNDEVQWQALPEWPGLYGLVEEIVASHASSHPGITTEAIVDSLVELYEMTPRETHHRERRRNHAERIRRLSHTVFRVLDADEGPATVSPIATEVLKAFILTPRPDAAGE